MRETLQALACGPRTLKIAQDEIEAHLRLVDIHKGLALYCGAKLSRRLQGLVVQGNCLSNGKSLSGLFRSLEKIVEGLGPLLGF
jgi:hypothetical protein